jgi:hypothetical protein
MRKYSRKRASNSPLGRTLSDRSTGRDLKGTALRPMSKVAAQTSIDELLPMPVQDNDIRTEMRALGNGIKNHAQSYFASNNSTELPSPKVYQHLSTLLGPSCPFGAKALNGMISDPRYRLAAIRFVLAWAIVQNIQMDGPPERTLLPPELAECMTTMKQSGPIDEGMLPQFYSLGFY